MLTYRERLKTLMEECWEDAWVFLPLGESGLLEARATLAAALFRARWTLEMGDERLPTGETAAWKAIGKIAEAIGRGEEES